MKDLTEQICDELNAQVVRMLEHSLAQASRIAELERQLAEASAPAVEQQPVGQIVDRNGGHNTPSLPPTPMPIWFNSMPAIGVKLYAAPQAADTDKVREVLQEICDMQAKHFGNGVETHLALISLADKGRAALAASMAAQAPVREVPEGIEDPITVPRGLVGAACYLIRKYEPDSKLLNKLRAFTIGRTEEAAPVQQEGA